MREYFDKKLNELRDETIKMGSLVEAELKMALEALEKLDVGLARAVHEADKQVNATRFMIEEHCTTLISTQQPLLQDLRAVLAVMNMIVDLERMGDQAKGIAKVIPSIVKHPEQSMMPELNEMGTIVTEMLRTALQAYAHRNIELAKLVIPRDDEVDRRFAQFFNRIMEAMAAAQSPEKVAAYYELLRAARELERFGDLATNVAERVIYISTGFIHEGNTDPDDIVDYHLRKK